MLVAMHKACAVRSLEVRLQGWELSQWCCVHQLSWCCVHQLWWMQEGLSQRPHIHHTYTRARMIIYAGIIRVGGTKVTGDAVAYNTKDVIRMVVVDGTVEVRACRFSPSGRVAMHAGTTHQLLRR